MRKKRLHARVLWAVAACWLTLLGTPLWAAEDPGTRGLQQHHLQRGQQEDALQLRMRQQQRATQAAPAAGAREKQALEQLHARQREQQQSRQYRQGIEPTPAAPADDAGARRAKAELERMTAQQESQRQLQRAESEQPAR